MLNSFTLTASNTLAYQLPCKSIHPCAINHDKKALAAPRHRAKTPPLQRQSDAQERKVPQSPRRGLRPRHCRKGTDRQTALRHKICESPSLSQYIILIARSSSALQATSTPEKSTATDHYGAAVKHLTGISHRLRTNAELSAD